MTVVSRLHPSYLTFNLHELRSHIAIDVVEQKARSIRDRIQVTGVSKSLLNPFLTEDENIEMLTRVETRAYFSNLLRAKLGHSDLQALEEVLFQIVYPSGTRCNTKGEAGG